MPESGSLTIMNLEQFFTVLAEDGLDNLQGVILACELESEASVSSSYSSAFGSNEI
jgi:hypothetical protein